MGVEFEKIEPGECLLCGAKSKLSGEHKIKASLIRDEFGKRQAIFAGRAGPKFAQGPKSKAYHFNARICQTCNSTSTQIGDRAFDILHGQLTELRAKGSSLTNSLHQPNCSLPDTCDFDCFRYFTKIICCYLAEVGGPRAKSLSKFALGHSNDNPIFLNISKDSDCESRLLELGSNGFAAHGGLIFGFDDTGTRLRSMNSSLYAGGIHYKFWVSLEALTALEFHQMFPDLIKIAQETPVKPIS